MQPIFDPTRRRRPIVVLGEFDGFHIGHRHLVHQASLLAMRFGHPLVGVVLDDGTAGQLLNGIDERCWALMASGVSSALAVTVDAPGSGDAGSLAIAEIIERLHPETIVMSCLPDDPASARYPYLRDECERHHVGVVEVPRWSDPDGRLISSARIRTALAAGDIARANDWLGRTFTLSGTVVYGSGLGRTIGFPTANLELPQHRLVPMNGVYAAIALMEDGEERRAAVNIGVRPTVEEDGKVLVEAHLLDFDGDIYGTRLQVGFRRWLRHEQRFASVDELITQLGSDVQRTGLLLRH